MSSIIWFDDHCPQTRFIDFALLCNNHRGFYEYFVAQAQGMCLWVEGDQLRGWRRMEWSGVVSNGTTTTTITNLRAFVPRLVAWSARLFAMFAYLSSTLACTKGSSTDSRLCPCVYEYPHIHMLDILQKCTTTCNYHRIPLRPFCRQHECVCVCALLCETYPR